MTPVDGGARPETMAELATFLRQNLLKQLESEFRNVPSPSSSDENKRLYDPKLLRSIGFAKRNFNLDHLARMNFRRSARDFERRATKFNNRHILSGL